eukprot:9502990-Pyramimonas_sp.AAC.1
MVEGNSEGAVLASASDNVQTGRKMRVLDLCCDSGMPRHPVQHQTDLTTLTIEYKYAKYGYSCPVFSAVTRNPKMS